MVDAVDFANDLVIQRMEQALAARKLHSGESLLQCEQCDTPIPLLRRQALPGVRLCIFCQRKAEIKQQGGRV